MAITMLEGFKYVPSSSTRYVAVNSGSGTSTWSRQANRSGGYALRHANSLTTDSTNTTGQIKFSMNNGTFSIGYATYYPGNYVGAANNLINGLALLNAANTFGINFTMHAGFSVNCALQSISGVTTPVITDSTPTNIGWHWWNVVGVWGNSSAGYVRLYRDGTKVVEIAPDTLDAGSTALQTCIIYIGNANASGGTDLCDLIVRDDATVITDTRIDVLAPTSDSATGFTRSTGATNYTLVDDAGPTVDTSDYISSNAASTADVYGVADLPFNPTTIYAVGAHAIGRKDSGGSRAAAVTVNGTEGPTQDTGSNGTVWGYWETNPSGGAAWTKANVDAMTAGIKIKT